MKNIGSFLLYIYRNLSYILPKGSCKFYPTCSEYAEQALKKYKTIKAYKLIVLRLLKCNPFNKGGYDPLI
ncbi:MAG: membrane protein insertion efficiency factor YidD [Candidatus Omnitrophica bacterium]|nr:membrane protein insertion efficiency factor YidD [Candidatus Omnitrophota bacterium]